MLIGWLCGMLHVDMSAFPVHSSFVLGCSWKDMQLQTYQGQKWQIVPTVCVPPLPSLQARHMSEIQRLMGCLLFVDRAPDDTPYADLLCGSRWDEGAHEFARQACSLMGQVRLVELPAPPPPRGTPDDTPYADLLCGSRWDEVAHDFARQACSLMGQVGEVAPHPSLPHTPSTHPFTPLPNPAP